MLCERVGSSFSFGGASTPARNWLSKNTERRPWWTQKLPVVGPSHTDAVYAMHNMPDIKAGYFAVHSGPTMSASDGVTILVHRSARPRPKRAFTT